MGNGLVRGVGQRQCDVNGPKLRRKFGCLAVEDNGWTPSRFALDFNIAPAYPVVPTRAKRFHRCLLGGKSRSIAFCSIRLGVAVTHLLFGEDSPQKALSKAGDGLGDAWH